MLTKWPRTPQPTVRLQSIVSASPGTPHFRPYSGPFWTTSRRASQRAVKDLSSGVRYLGVSPMGWVRCCQHLAIEQNLGSLPVAQIVHSVQAGAISGRKFAHLATGVPWRPRCIAAEQWREIWHEYGFRWDEYRCACSVFVVIGLKTDRTTPKSPAQPRQVVGRRRSSPHI